MFQSLIQIWDMGDCWDMSSDLMLAQYSCRECNYQNQFWNLRGLKGLSVFDCFKARHIQCVVKPGLLQHAIVFLLVTCNCSHVYPTHVSSHRNHCSTKHLLHSVHTKIGNKDSIVLRNIAIPYYCFQFVHTVWNCSKPHINVLSGHKRIWTLIDNILYMIFCMIVISFTIVEHVHSHCLNHNFWQPMSERNFR